MINREQFINEIAEVVNRNSMEKAFNDTPDFILARIAVEAMEMFTRASAHRDDNLEWCDNQYNNTYNGKHNKIAKSVIQYSKAGNEIARYKSIREAERKTGIQNITITRCCKGVYKTAGGYVWEYDLTIKEV